MGKPLQINFVNCSQVRKNMLESCNVDSVSTSVEPTPFYRSTPYEAPAPATLMTWKLEMFDQKLKGCHSLLHHQFERDVKICNRPIFQ